MSGDKKWTRRAAIGFIGAGAGLFALNTGAATQIYSDRGVNLGTIGDTEALLPLIDESGNAGISSADDKAVVYRIGESDLNWSFTDDIDILNVQHTSGDHIDQADIDIAVSGNRDEIVLSCSGSDFSGKYKLSLTLGAQSEGENGSLSITLERETQSISINCKPFYTNSENYRDNADGTAEIPGDFDAKGKVTNAGNIGTDDGSVATIEEAETGGGNISLLVGFVLPPVGSSDCYTLTVRMRDGGGGNLRAYLRDDSGNDVSDKFQVKDDFDDDNTVQITGVNTDKIADAEQLYLLFEGSGNQSHEIEFINLKAGCS